jgi:hypothetical protein
MPNSLKLLKKNKTVNGWDGGNFTHHHIHDSEQKASLGEVPSPTKVIILYLCMLHLVLSLHCIIKNEYDKKTKNIYLCLHMLHVCLSSSWK